MVRGMAGSTRRSGSRLTALVAAGLLGVGLAVMPGAVAFASESETETDSSIVVEARYGNILCVLFPEWRMCKKK